VSSGRNNHQRLAALVEAALADAEARLQAGQAVPVAELNGLRRLVEALARDQETEQAIELGGQQPSDLGRRRGS
jgi:hypothetical protein